MNDPRHERTIRLIGEAAFAKLRRSSVLVVGVGGVGAYSAEHLARAGVGHLMLVDGDTVELSNCNRQLPALTSTVGRDKTEVLKERFLDIDPSLEVTTLNRFLTVEEVPPLLDAPYDFVIDAIDDVPVKCALLAEAYRRRIPVVSSMGSAGKCDPGKIMTADLSKTFGCPLARAVRHRLKEAGVTKGIRCVFSPEEPVKAADGGTPGTLSFLPAAFGSFLAAAAVNTLLASE